MNEGSFEGVEGVRIFTREWQPAGRPRGVVVISHGLNAHSGLYDWTARQFTASGLSVYALDHRGRGRSGGERFFVRKFADWTSDLRTFIDIVKARQPGLPVQFMSGYADRTFGPEGPGGLGDAFLQKPFALDVLVARVRQILGGSTRADGEADAAPPPDEAAESTATEAGDATVPGAPPVPSGNPVTNGSGA